jgi:hypothetical protein
MSIFGVIVVLLIGAIAYFHYTQGFLSATLSAIFAVLAAVLAVSYHEPLEALVSRGGLAEYSRAITLIALFGGIYILLRAIFDRFVPGNIRLPVLMDRVGAGAMGVVAGIFATGMMALAAQTMPFGASIAGYSQYEMQPAREMPIPGPRAYNIDVIVGENLQEQRPDTFTEEDRQSLIVPVDRMVVGLVDGLSEGSLAGRRAFSEIHPDYVLELYGQRLGIQTGATRIAVNDERVQHVRVAGVYQLEGQIPQVDAEVHQLRDPARVNALKSPFSARGDEVAVVVRIIFTRSASDTDNLARFSPGSVRLVTNRTNYWPVGAMEGNMLVANKIDDPLLVNVGDRDRGADMVFRVMRADMEAGGETGWILPEGAFVEVKRARVDLSNQPLRPAARMRETTGDYEIRVLRKSHVQQAQ